MLGNNGVLLIPTFPTPALHHNQSFFYVPGGAYCLLFNIFGFPATHVPMGLNKEGLPIGFQVILYFSFSLAFYYLSTKIFISNNKK